MNVTIAEIAVTEFATGVINDISKRKKMSGMTVAHFIPGVVHDHAPCDFVVDSCAYCARNGNVFADDQAVPGQSCDIIGKYRSKIKKILDEMETEIVEITDKNMVLGNADDDDDELERMLMEELS